MLQQSFCRTKYFTWGNVSQLRHVRTPASVMSKLAVSSQIFNHFSINSAVTQAVCERRINNEEPVERQVAQIQLVCA